MKALSVLLFSFLAASAYAYTVTAYKTGEQRTGQTKQCYYRYAGNTYTITIRAHKTCPSSIKVNPYAD